MSRPAKRPRGDEAVLKRDKRGRLTSVLIRLLGRRRKRRGRKKA